MLLNTTTEAKIAFLKAVKKMQVNYWDEEFNNTGAQPLSSPTPHPIHTVSRSKQDTARLMSWAHDHSITRQGQELSKMGGGGEP